MTTRITSKLAAVLTLATALLSPATAATVPTVATPTSASITNTTATLGGDVTSDGGTTVTEVGVVYAPTWENNNPPLGGYGVTKVKGTGPGGILTVNVSGLDASTAYSFAAYATNAMGTSYSAVGAFSTITPILLPHLKKTL